jgi:hypothetical protein
MSWCIRGIIFKERGQNKGEWKERKFRDKKGRGQNKGEWKERKFSDKKGRESLLQALQERRE